MTENVTNLVNFHKHKTALDFEIGDICIYQEGIVKGKVKILSKNTTETHISYLLETIENLSRFPLPKQFEVGTRKDYLGYCWSLT